MSCTFENDPPTPLSRDLERQSWEHIGREEKVCSPASPFLSGLLDYADEKDQESQSPERAGVRKRDGGGGERAGRWRERARERERQTDHRQTQKGISEAVVPVVGI